MELPPSIYVSMYNIKIRRLTVKVKLKVYANLLHKCDGHCQVRWSAPKSYGMLPIRTPKVDGDGIKTHVTP